MAVLVLAGSALAVRAQTTSATVVGTLTDSSGARIAGGTVSIKDIATGIKVYAAKGCTNCTDGYKGRVGIYQVMEVTEELGRIIMAGGHAQNIAEQAVKEGVWDLRRSGLEKVRSGMTTLEEINSVTTE